jgi:cytochrome P450
MCMLEARVPDPPSRETTGDFPELGGALPWVGHFPFVMFDPRRMYVRAEAKLGPNFWVRQFGARTLVSTSPDALALLKNKTTTSEHYREVAGALLGDSLIVTDGQRHTRVRQSLAGGFTPRGLTASGAGARMAETIEQHVRAWVQKGEVKILPRTRELALDVVFRLIGLESRDLPVWRKKYETFLLNAILPRFDVPGAPRWRGRRAQVWLDERLVAMVRGARRDPDGTSLIAQLVRPPSEGGDALSDHDLVENLRLLTIAGHETSGTTMAWLALQLAARRDVLERLMEEVDKAPRVPRTPAELRQFPYAEAVFREALRLHPPVHMVSRRVTEPTPFAGRILPPGVEVIVSLDRISRHPSLYRDPDDFLPTRWLGRNEPPTATELAQFGGGPHFCLGYHTAWMEIVQFAVALGIVLRERSLEPRLASGWPATRFAPLAHPAASARIRFVSR